MILNSNSVKGKKDSIDLTISYYGMDCQVRDDHPGLRTKPAKMSLKNINCIHLNSKWATESQMRMLKYDNHQLFNVNSEQLHRGKDAKTSARAEEHHMSPTLHFFYSSPITL